MALEGSRDVTGQQLLLRAEENVLLLLAPLCACLHTCSFA
jgi:hypothetical protein